MRELHAEAALLAGLRHPCVLRFMGVCVMPPALVTEWCARGSLWDVLCQGRKDSATAAQLTVGQRLRMAVEAGTGLLYLHSRGIVHRDIKSPNLLVDADLHVKVGPPAAASAHSLVALHPCLNAPACAPLLVHPWLCAPACAPIAAVARCCALPFGPLLPTHALPPVTAAMTTARSATLGCQRSWPAAQAAATPPLLGKGPSTPAGW